MRVLKKLKISTTISEDRGLMLQLNLHTKSAKKIVSYVGKQKNKIRQDFCGSIPLKFWAAGRTGRNYSSLADMTLTAVI